QTHPTSVRTRRATPDHSLVRAFSPLGWFAAGPSFYRSHVLAARTALPQHRGEGGSGQTTARAETRRPQRISGFSTHGLALLFSATRSRPITFKKTRIDIRCLHGRHIKSALESNILGETNTLGTVETHHNRYIPEKSRKIPVANFSCGKH